MKYYTLLLLTLFSASCYSQTKKNNVEIGLYSGGVCVDDGICGFWIVKADSNFIFLNFKDSKLKQFGTGHWQQLKDGQLKFSFSKQKPEILEWSEFEYSSSTQKSNDSIYVSGQIKNQRKVAVTDVALIFGDRTVLHSDSNGYFNGKFLRSKVANIITIMNRSSGYVPLEFSLSKSNNFHKLNIIIPEVDSNTCIAVFNENSLLSWKESTILPINRNPAKLHSNISLIFQSSQLNGMVAKLNEAKKSQPFLETNIKKLIEMILK